MLDTAGGMGRHLGIFSCTMLKYTLSLLLLSHTLTSLLALA